MAQEYMRSVIVGDGRWPYTAGGLLFKDDIEGIFEWSSTGTGSGYVVEHSMNYAFEGDYSMHLKTRITGAASGDVAEGYRLLGMIPEKSLMLSCFYLPVSDVLLAYIYFDLRHYDGTDGEVARVRYDYANTRWQYYNSSGLYTNISGGAQDLHNEAWHSFALSANYSTDKYISMISDGAIFDLSAYSYYKFSTAEPGHVRIVFKVETFSASAAEAYFDNVNVSIV